MKKITLFVLILSISSCWINNTNKKHSSKEVVELEVLTKELNNYSIISELKELGISDLEITRSNDSIFQMIVPKKIKQQEINKILGRDAIKVFKTYKTELLGILFIKLGWKYSKSVLSPDNSKFANFSINDTSKINQTIYQDNYIKELPQDLSFSWLPAESKDSVALYLIKKDAGISDLSSNNFLDFTTSISSERYASSFDDNHTPIEWDEITHYILHFKLDNIGTEQFHDLTVKYISEHIAFSINNMVVSVPEIIFPIEGGEANMSLSSENGIKVFYKALFFYNYNNIEIKTITYK